MKAAGKTIAVTGGGKADRLSTHVANITHREAVETLPAAIIAGT